MSNDYFHYQAAKDREAQLVRAAEQHRLVRQAVESGRSRQKGGAARPLLRGIRLFGRSTRPSAC